MLLELFFCFTFHEPSVIVNKTFTLVFLCLPICRLLQRSKRCIEWGVFEKLGKKKKTGFCFFLPFLHKPFSQWLPSPLPLWTRYTYVILLQHRSESSKARIRIQFFFPTHTPILYVGKKEQKIFNVFFFVNSHRGVRFAVHTASRIHIHTVHKKSSAKQNFFF